MFANVHEQKEQLVMMAAYSTHSSRFPNGPRSWTTLLVNGQASSMPPISSDSS
jgi:hypothetical protein